jgi:ABC-type dipeptide/oligopeptide/nickel transport system permease component
MIPRILMAIPTLIGVSFVTFLLLSNVPGDPVYALVGERADAKLLEAYREKLGLDQNVAVRYLRYVKMLLQGDLGKSYYTGRAVQEEISQKMPNTILLACASMLFATLFGLILGMICAFWTGSWLDRVLWFLSTLLISLPVFWFGMLNVFVFAVTLRWFPAGGMDHPLSIVLPAFTLGSRSLAYLTRLTRSCMIEILQSPYILAVRAKGASTSLILWHAFRNAVIPIITFIGLDFGSYLNGSVLTETIFGWDGLGRYAILGILRRDYPVILGTVLWGALLFIAVNMLIDCIYYYLNPKLRKAVLEK